jgi:predicted transposase/invertase (TIGR01784 family)
VLTNQPHYILFSPLYSNNFTYLNVFCRSTEQIRREGIQVGHEKGRAEGVQIGEERGRAEGVQQAKVAVAKNSLKAGVSIDVIAEITGLPVDEIKQP